MSNGALICAILIFLFALNVANAIKEYNIRKHFDETTLELSKQETERLKALMKRVAEHND